MRFWNRKERERDLERELASDLELEAAERQATGLTPAQARLAARRALGNRALVEESVREAWGWTFLDRFRQDLIYAFRGLRKSPGFAATAVLSLALGIGANTAIFSLIDAVLLRWLPVRAPQELTQIVLRRPSAEPLESLTYPLVRALADHREIFSSLCGFSGYRFAVGQEDSIETTSGAWVSGGYYATLGLQPVAGRLLTDADDQPGATPVAVITDTYWDRKFARKSDAIGQKIIVEGKPVVIVGVSPSGFTGANVGETADITLSLGVLPQIRPDRSYDIDNGSWWLRVLARPQPGVSREQARARLAVVWHLMYESVVEGMSAGARRRMEQSTPDLLPGATGYTDLRRRFQRPLLILMAVVGLLLLIACANVANLLLARASARQREIAVRLAIGAGRGRIVRQLLTESLLLSLLGAAAGIVLAWAGSRALVNLLSNGQQPPLTLDVTPDWLVLLFTSLTALVTGIGFGIAPAFRGTAVGPAGALREKIAIARSRLAPILVSVQVSVALLLLAAGGLFVRTLENLQGVQSGFRPEGVLVANADAAREGYRGANAVAFYDDMLAKIERLPGVQRASYSLITPLAGGGISAGVSLNGRSIGEPYFNSVSRGYFATLGTPVLLGREFDVRDSTNAPKVAVVNQAFARKFLGANPLGQRLTVNANPKPLDFEVVGVVADAIYESLWQAAPPTVYCPVAQREAGRTSGLYVTMEARVAGSFAQPAKAIRDAMQPMLPGSPVEVHALTEQVERSLVRERLMANLGAGFAVLGLLLAAIGLYGLLTYSVARRTNEIGIRLALGARRRAVLWMVVRQVLLLLAAGIAIGIPVAWAASRFVSSMMFGLKARDPLTLGVAAAVLAVAGVAAGFVPAWRASRVDPMTALRYE